MALLTFKDDPLIFSPTLIPQFQGLTRKRARILGVVLLLVTLPAASEVKVDKTVIAQKGTLDELFLRVADRVPAFAGIAYEDNKLRAYVALPKRKLRRIRPKLIASLTEVFGEELESGLTDLQLMSVTHSTRDLQAHFTALAELFSDKSVAFIDVDEVNNSLTVGVHKAGHTQLLTDRAIALGIPKAMLRFESAVELALAAELRDRIRPVPGGVQIRRNGVPGHCSIGANVQTDSGVGFITASHCTHRMGVASFFPTAFNQAASPNTVGHEQLDPHFRNWLLCPNSAFADGCRFSDSVFVGYNNSNQNPDMGRIARLGSWGYGPISTVDDDYNITSLRFSPVSGERMMKVGRTTGKTAGNVSRTCVTMPVPPAWWLLRDLGLVCQNFVTRVAGVGGGPTQPIVDSGDSGGPVFRLNANSAQNTVAFAGILHSGDVAGTVFVFSSTFGVVADMAPWLGSISF